MKKITVLILIVMAVFSSLTYAENKKYIIDVPNPCVKVRKIEKNRVYLTNTQEKCIQVISKLPIEIESTYKSVYIYIDNVFWKEQTLNEFGISVIREQMEEKRKVKEKDDVKITENIYRKEGEQKAKNTAEIYYSKEFQEKIDKEIERLRITVFKEPLRAIDRYSEDIDREKIMSNIELTDNERIYIFISSSIPISTLRNYAADIDKLGGKNIVMVLRGMKGGMEYIGPTIEFISDIIKKDKDCDILKRECDTYNIGVQVDPLLFRRYNINKVPAIVYVDGVEVINTQNSEGLLDNVKVNNFYIVYGDVTLDYAIEKINESVRSKKLDNIIQTLRSGFYSARPEGGQ